MLIKAENLAKSFRGMAASKILVVQDANIHINSGETVGLRGSSGSGKTTIGCLIAGLLRPDKGAIQYEGNILRYPFQKEYRRKIQILFQQPEVSFNPRLPLITSLLEPYRLLHIPVNRNTLLEDLTRFGLYEEHLMRFPGELSGGELQRAALARILIFHPKMIVLDEPTSMLDSISQAQMIQLLNREQAEHGTAYLFISHNKSLTNKICNRIYSIQNHYVEEESK